MSDPRTELVQIAAVCCAIIEDLDYGEANNTIVPAANVRLDVARERERQDAKWGPQHHTLAEWLMILAEEVGELAEAVGATVSIGGGGSDGYALDAYDNLRSAGDWARHFIGGHAWPERQQQVIDEERE
jgi:hypothetical protein